MSLFIFVSACLHVNYLLSRCSGAILFTSPYWLWLPDALLYPRIRWSALFRGYACVSYCYRTCFLTREFDGQPHFAGKPAETSLAIRAFLPANPMVCPVSRVNPQKPHLPDLFSYPRILVCSVTCGQQQNRIDST